MKGFKSAVISVALCMSGWVFAQSDCNLKTNPPDYQCLQKQYAQPIKSWPAPTIDLGVTWQELAPLPQFIPAPKKNPFTEAKRDLGEQLFFDPQLSRSGQISCASCHKPDLAFADGLRVSTGHQGKEGRRNSPSIVMSGLLEPLFWDGRKATLEEQSLAPIEDPVEMAFSLSELEQRLIKKPVYISAFAQVFDDKPTAHRVAQALASYQRSLLPRDTAFEQFMLGDSQALTDQQLWGLHLFRTKGRCLNCHQGTALSDEQFHNLGLTYYGRKYEDLGRYEVTGQTEDVGAFRTPSLRLVSQTGPWMHNGLFSNLEGILNMYNAGMASVRPNIQQQSDPLFPKKSQLLKPLALTKPELAALKAFLESL